MRGQGAVFLKQSFDVLARQTFTDFDVVISDHSRNDAIEKLCQEYSDRLDIHYFRNTENIGSSSANMNNAIRHATGTLIKMLFQDDFLFDENSLKVIANNFDISKDHWLVTACESTRDGVTFYRPFYPRYHAKIHLGPNTISSPSVVTVINKEPLLFDENLIWYMDCDYYKRMGDAYGAPKIVNEIGVVNRTGEHQVTNTLATDTVKDAEFTYILKKYHERFSTLRALTRRLKRLIKRS